MTNEQAGDAIGERLERLRRATFDIAPSSGFEARVLASVVARRRRRGPLVAVLPIGPRAIIVGVLAAAAAIAAAYHAEAPADDDVVVAADTGWWVP